MPHNNAPAVPGPPPAAAGIDVAKEKAGLPPDQDVTLVVLPARKGLFELLFERQEDAEVATARVLPPQALALLRWAASVTPGPIARLPFDLRVR